MKAQINIIGEIGVEVKLMDIISQMKQFQNPTEMEIFINSVGGFVGKADEIYNYLEGFNLPTKTIASGICASAATKLMLLGETREVVKGTRFMIHNPFVSGIKGDAETLKEYSNQLQKIENDFIAFYSSKLDQPKLAIQPLMKRETFLTENELLTLGFATEITDGEVKPTELKAVAKLEKFNIKSNEMSVQLDEKSQKSLVEKIEGVIKNLFNPKAVLELADANGNVLRFPELEPEQSPEVGSVVSAEDGTYQVGDVLMKVEAGAIASISEVEASDDELEKMTKEMEAKEKELEEIKAKLSEVENSLKEKSDLAEKAKAQLEEIRNTVSGFELPKKAQPQAKANEPKAHKGLIINYKKK